MKNYDETINSVFNRMKEYELEKRKRGKFISKAIASTCCILLVALLGGGVWQSNLFKTTPPAIFDDGNTSQQDTQTGDEPSSNSSEVVDVTPDAPIIWGNVDSDIQDAGYIEWNGKTITLPLYEVLSSEKTENSLIAIAIGFEVDDKFVYNGKSLAEYAAEEDNERSYYGKMGQLLKLGDSLKYGEALYKTGTPTGEKWAKELYEEIVNNLGTELIEKYIVDGEFLKEKLEFDIANCKGQETCRIAYEVARQAYYQFVVEAAITELEMQNISYDRRNDTELVFYATAQLFSSFKVENVLFYGLALKEDEGMDLVIPFVE